MAYDKDLPPVAASLAARQAYLERELTKVQQEFVKHADAINGLAAYRIIGGIEAPYIWNDDVDTTTDPGTGNIKADQTNLGAGVTQVAISKIDALSRDIGESFHGDEMIGQIILLIDQDAASRLDYVVTGTTDFPTWVQHDCTVSQGNGNPGAGDFFTFTWYASVSILGVQRAYDVAFEKFAARVSRLSGIPQ